MPNPKKDRSATARSTHGVTLFEVAKLAGVAPITVSRVINQPEQVKESTRLKILRVIEETGYVRNQIAGALASNRTRLVAVVVPMLTNPIFSDTYQAIAARLASADYQVLLGISGYQAEQEQELLEVVLSRRPDGIILTGTVHTDVSRRRLRATGIPVVETWDLTDEPIDMLVGFSHEAIGRRTAEHLLAQGFRDFMLLEVDDPRGIRRGDSFKEQLARAGVTLLERQRFHGVPTLEQGRQGLVDMLHLLNRPQANASLAPEIPSRTPILVCSSDTLAHGVLTEAASRGLGVPAQVAVMGFGDMNFAAHTFPALSTVKIDGAAIGRRAASALLARLKNTDEGDALTLDVGFTLIDRDSTGPSIT